MRFSDFFLAGSLKISISFLFFQSLHQIVLYEKGFQLLNKSFLLFHDTINLPCTGWKFKGQFWEHWTSRVQNPASTWRNRGSRQIYQLSERQKQTPWKSRCWKFARSWEFSNSNFQNAREFTWFGICIVWANFT